MAADYAPPGCKRHEFNVHIKNEKSIDNIFGIERTHKRSVLKSGKANFPNTVAWTDYRFYSSKLWFFF